KVFCKTASVRATRHGRKEGLCRVRDKKIDKNTIQQVRCRWRRLLLSARADTCMITPIIKKYSVVKPCRSLTWTWTYSSKIYARCRLVPGRRRYVLPPSLCEASPSSSAFSPPTHASRASCVI